MRDFSFKDHRIQYSKCCLFNKSNKKEHKQIQSANWCISNDFFQNPYKQMCLEKKPHPVAFFSLPTNHRNMFLSNKFSLFLVYNSTQELHHILNWPVVARWAQGRLTSVLFTASNASNLPWFSFLYNEQKLCAQWSVNLTVEVWKSISIIW